MRIRICEICLLKPRQRENRQNADTNKGKQCASKLPVHMDESDFFVTPFSERCYKNNHCDRPARAMGNSSQFQQRASPGDSCEWGRQSYRLYPSTLKRAGNTYSICPTICEQKPYRDTTIPEIHGIIQCKALPKIDLYYRMSWSGSSRKTLTAAEFPKRENCRGRLFSVVGYAAAAALLNAVKRGFRSGAFRGRFWSGSEQDQVSAPGANRGAPHSRIALFRAKAEASYHIQDVHRR